MDSQWLFTKLQSKLSFAREILTIPDFSYFLSPKNVANRNIIATPRTRTRYDWLIRRARPRGESANTVFYNDKQLLCAKNVTPRALVGLQIH